MVPPAVYVRGAHKQYGRGEKAYKVLDGLDMTVERCSIYGLLGASGCGKTTLLTCIVGRRRLGSGDIWVLGGKPGSRGSGVPGPRLGYMPQELSLMGEFTVKDALYHFGWIYGMSNEKIEERFEFLKKLLELPAEKIKHLSGGQQRRVSLAVALVHEPELLILDEPTVGLDPVLRQSIWNHLVEISTGKKTTIIITTHYIEEARQAHKVGLMRNGKLLAEGAPESLIRCYNSNSLEEVFLKLSSQEITTVEQQEVMPEEDGELSVESEEEKSASNKCYCHSFLEKSKGHAKALLTKNFYRITRHPGAIVFIFLFPMVEICAFYLAIGGWPAGLKLGIVNEELQNFSSCKEIAGDLGKMYGGTPTVNEDGLPYCILRGLSCKYLDLLEDKVADKVYFNDLEEAMTTAKAGKLLGVLHFSKEFSKAFENRLDSGAEASNVTIESSELSVWMDMSRRQSALLIEQKIREAHERYLEEIFSECKIPSSVGSIPVHIYPPIAGNKEINFSQFMTPGVIITMIFFISVGVTSTIIVVERLDGIWDRTLCAGVSSAEILLSHIVIEMGIILLQVAEVFLFVFYVFNIPCKGSFFDIMVLLFLQGFTGMSGGFLVSVSCNSVTASNFVSMGSFYPILILSGLLWPIEGMPHLLRVIAMGMPTTLATNSLRNVMEKGWGMFENHVYDGYIISIVWIVLFSVSSLIVIKLRK